MMLSRARFFVYRRLRYPAGCHLRTCVAGATNVVLSRQTWRLVHAPATHSGCLQPHRAQASMARFPSVGVTAQANLEELDELSQRLYDHMFAPFGVSVEQFALLTRIAARHKLEVGDVVVKGGAPNRKVFLLVRGWAIAYQHDFTDSGSSAVGAPVCQYVGKLETNQEGQHKQLVDGVKLPTRASVIGGSALCDARLAAEHNRKLYPFHVVAGTRLDLLEWDIMLLQRFINRPKYRAVQASLYYSLYVDLIGTLDRGRAIDMILSKRGPVVAEQKPAAALEDTSPPSRQQLGSLFVFIAVPFVGFGFADNFIMIICGDYIDATLGVKMGISTLAAAGIGNWMSDLAGLSLGDMIERGAARLGLTKGGLSPAQETLQIAKMTSLAGKIIGISIGCFIGMFPLLFLHHPKKEFTVEELELYDAAFVSSGVSTVQFENLMEKGTRRSAAPGQRMVDGNGAFNKIILLIRGECQGHKSSGGVSLDLAQRPDCRWTGRLQYDERQTSLTVPFRGSVIGGSAIADRSLVGKPYPYDIVATSPVDFIEWNSQDVFDINESVPALQAAFFSMLYQDIKMSKISKNLEVYRAVIEVVVADGLVSSEEEALVDSAKYRFGVSEEEHFAVLAELGWTRQRWEHCCDRSRRPQANNAIVIQRVTEIEEMLSRVKAILTSK